MAIESFPTAPGQAGVSPVPDQTSHGVNKLSFTFSDLITGYVTRFNRAQKTFGLRTSDGRDFEATLTPSTYARISQNLEEPYQDCTARIGEMLEDGQYVFAYGVFYPTADGTRFEVKSLVFPGEKAGAYRHEEPDWWINQVRSIADCYLRSPALPAPSSSTCPQPARALRVRGGATCVESSLRRAAGLAPRASVAILPRRLPAGTLPMVHAEVEVELLRRHGCGTLQGRLPMSAGTSRCCSRTDAGRASPGADGAGRSSARAIAMRSRRGG
jgi:hypothetical protein